MKVGSYEALFDEFVQSIEQGNVFSVLDRLESLRKEGDSDAMTCLGGIYLTGDMHLYELGIIPDSEMGIELLTQASEMNNPHADVMLAELYRDGADDVAVDLAKSHCLFEKAALANLPEAYGQCALNYLLGQGVSEDYQKALDFAQKGAELGNEESLMVCGDIYETGKGVPANLPMAADYYRAALAMNPENANVMCALALCLVDPFDPNGLYSSPAETDEAFELLCKAVELGDVRAHYIIGAVYANGVGVEQDYNLAHHYIELAANNGFEAAQEDLGQFRRTMRGGWTV